MCRLLPPGIAGSPRGVAINTAHTPRQQELITLLLRFNDEDLKAQVGTVQWGHGQHAFHQGRVASCDWDGDTFVGRVRADGLAYKVTLSVQERRLRTHCACLLEGDCQHTVAVFLHARDKVFAQQPFDSACAEHWREELDLLIGGSGATGEPLALYIEVRTPGEEIWLTPMRPGQNRRWVTKRASWTDLTSTQWASVTDGLNPTHVAAFRDGYRLSRQGREWFSPGEVSLSSIGEEAFQWLCRLNTMGVTLLCDTHEWKEIALEHGGPHTYYQLSRGADGIILTPKLRPAPPTHSVGFHDPNTGLFIMEGGCRLRSETRSVPSSHQELPQITIPHRDEAEFYAYYREALSARFDIDTDEDEKSEHPRLCMSLTQETPHTLCLSWGLTYITPHGPSTVPLHPDRLERGHSDPRIDDLLKRVWTDIYNADIDGFLVRALGQHASPYAHWLPLRLPSWQGPGILDMSDSLCEHPDIVWQIAPEIADHVVSEDPVEVSLSLLPAHDQDWFDLHATLSVGHEQVPFERVLRAVAAGEEYLHVNGSWVRIEAERIEQLRDLLTEAALLGHSSNGNARIQPWHVSLWDSLRALADYASWHEQWGERINALPGQGQIPPLPVVDIDEESLRSYQREGHEWLTGLMRSQMGGILADDMGLGKTLQLLAAVASYRRHQLTITDNSHLTPVLVIAPTSVVGIWKAEARRWFPHLRVETVTSTQKKATISLDECRQRADMIVTSYAVARLDAALWAEHEWGGLIIDEAQMVKNPRTAAHQALEQLQAPWRIAVTGTPIENSLTDVWAILRLTCPGLLPRWTVFNEGIRRPIEQEGSADALERFHTLVAPFILRRTKDAVAADLPERSDFLIDVPLSPEHRHLYERYLTRERAHVLGILRQGRANRMDILAAMTRLRQLALDPALVDREYAHIASAKTELLIEHLEQIVPGGHQVLVFSQFTSYLARIARALAGAGISFVQLDGTTRHRQAIINAFREGKASVFLISLKAGGTGLTLTEADYVYVMDPWWNPAAEAQAIDRTHRIGQDKKVTVYRLVAQGTIEHKVIALQERKRGLVDAVMDEASLGKTQLQVEDIRALFDAAW